MEFEFNKYISYGSALYDPDADIIILNLGQILRCDEITDDEKIRLMTWQIEHEVIHSVINKLEGRYACGQFDDVSWTIQDKKEFLEIIHIAKRMGYSYNNPCKYLEK